MPRVTINEIARRSGVSKGAVSYALNGRPGVSEATRERILQVAGELGWAPNRTARLLSGSRTDTFGLILARDPKTLGSEPFWMEFVAGMEGEMADRSYALLLQVTADLDAELETYKKWSSERRVDAVAVVDERVDDPRLALLRNLELPAVFVGDPSMAEGFTTVWTDDHTAMVAAVHELVALGHRRIARIAGIADFAHVVIRDDAFNCAMAEAGADGWIVHADYSGEQGKKAARELMAATRPPTAIIFDNDLMAIASLSAFAEAGIDVPGDVTLLAWDDSALCTLTHPQLSAMSHDVVAFGAHVARRLFGVLEGVEPAAYLDSTPQFQPRGSTGPPPHLAGR